jgi:hypothetical protein
MPKRPTKGDSEGYDVGYRKPPRASQFKPGRSGNPRGRPVASISVSDAMEKVLSRKVNLTLDGKRKRVPITEALMWKSVREALESNPNLAIRILNLAETKRSALDRVKAERPVEETPERKRELQTYVDSVQMCRRLTQLGAIKITQDGHLKISKPVVDAILSAVPPETPNERLAAARLLQFLLET